MAAVIAASASSMGASAVTSYSYGTNPVVKGSVSRYSGNRYTTKASIASYTKNVSVGVSMTHYFYNSAGKLKSRSVSATDNETYSSAAVSLTTPTGCTFNYATTSNYRNDINFANYKLTKK